jgi:hypothetical protein
MAQRSKAGILTTGILANLPGFVMRWLKDHPPEAMQKALSHRIMARSISKRLLQKRRELSGTAGEPDADLFNILGVLFSTSRSIHRSYVFSTLSVNTNDKSASKISEDDLHDQFGAITVAGEETTVSAFECIDHVDIINFVTDSRPILYSGSCTPWRNIRSGKQRCERKSPKHPIRILGKDSTTIDFWS